MTGHLDYLEAKRALDDRALDRDVLATAFEPLSDEPRIAEVGAGTVPMVERLHEWDVLNGGKWVAVDSDAEALRRGRARLLDRPDAAPTDAGIVLGDVDVRLVEADAFEYAARAPPADLLVGCAFFDLVDPGRLSALASLADRVYAPITYDGTTAFEPADPEDGAVLAAYREHMRDSRPGSPDGGEALRATLSTVETVGASPWRVEPPYDPGERTVVEHVLGTIEAAVGEVGYDASAWTRRRQAQLEAGRLCYRAENVDVVGRL